MINQDEPKELEEQADRIRRAEEEAGLKPATPDPETVDYRSTVKGYRIGTEFVFTILAFLFVGWVLDRWLSTEPWALLVFVLAGFAVGMMNLWRAMNLSSNGQNKRD